MQGVLKIDGQHSQFMVHKGRYATLTQREGRGTMTTESATLAPIMLPLPGDLPALIVDAGERTAWRFVEFFTATNWNSHTREAYASAVGRFLAWCEGRGLRDLRALTPVVVAAYIEQLQGSNPTVKQYLAAICQCFDWLVTGGMLEVNPAASVRGPTCVIKKGKTPVLDTEQTRALLEAIDTDTIVGLRDRALIGAMVYSFARVSAIIGMRVEDYYPNGKRWWFRLHEKGGKFHEVPTHHKAEEYMDAYLKAAGLGADLKGPLIRTVNRERQLMKRPMHRNDAIRMIKRRSRGLNLPPGICCHPFRATGITAYLENGGTIEHAQAIAAHESPRTTKLYDRTGDAITLDEIECILI
jgi:integrase/recombinase XerD